MSKRIAYCVQSSQIVHHSIKILVQFVEAREKPRQAFKDTIGRCLTNVLIYLDVTKPRSFDSEELTKELPLD